MKTSEFISAAKDGVVTVEFEKINTKELRVMPCTLNTVLSNHNVPEILEQKSDNEHLVVWAMDKQSWRSFRVSTVKRWYEGYPEVAGPDNS